MNEIELVIFGTLRPQSLDKLLKMSGTRIVQGEISSLTDVGTRITNRARSSCDTISGATGYTYCTKFRMNRSGESNVSRSLEIELPIDAEKFNSIRGQFERCYDKLRVKLPLTHGAIAEIDIFKIAKTGHYDSTVKVDIENATNRSFPYVIEALHQHGIVFSEIINHPNRVNDTQQLNINRYMQVIWNFARTE